jgi:catechol 2,3-dioxygenase-like lactoylglutathione lyase family enzyme
VHHLTFITSDMDRLIAFYQRIFDAPVTFDRVEGQILDVLRRVKGGKEANVYCCRTHPSTGVDLLAAKLYRPRMFRNLRSFW